MLNASSHLIVLGRWCNDLSTALKSSEASALNISLIEALKTCAVSFHEVLCAFCGYVF